MKATLFALLSLLISLGFFALLFRPWQPANHPRQSNNLPPAPAPSPQVQAQITPADPNEKFRVVPPNFTHVDFKNRYYGQYKNAIELNLTDGRYEYSDGPGKGEWFDLKDVYYTDVTGDDSPEAIVFLWHVGCNVSCDGGNALFLVFRNHRGSLKEIWRFETGSYAYGCGLKSLAMMKKQITVQMFGKCANPELGYNGPAKFLVGDTTLSNFRFSGGWFVKRETEFFYAPIKDVKNFEPQIHIID